jgi:yeast amino acid transporter
MNANMDGNVMPLDPVPQDDEDSPVESKYEFKARHIQMMALGSAMASSLFFQSGKALYTSGPVSMWLASCFMGTVSYAVLV